MLEWLFVFLFPGAADVTHPKQDLVGVVAAEAAYTALQPTAAPVKPKVPTKDCKTCNGSGRVKTGDGHDWTKCPDCDPNLGAQIKTPKSEPDRYKIGDCPDGRCRVYQAYRV